MVGATLSQQEHGRCAYAHLLQPIKALADNWDINIASELEEYLDVLEHVTISFEDGPSLNFAEAALVIQGSACVYSRKVEYLHTLVHQALEFVTNNHRHKEARTGGRQNDDSGGFDDEEQFLNLDDILEEGTGIDLQEGEGEQVATMVRPPAAILALEDSNGNGHGDGDAGNYRIATFAVHHSGALLLESADGEALDACLRHTTSRTSAQFPGHFPTPAPEPHMEPASTDPAGPAAYPSDDDDHNGYAADDPEPGPAAEGYEGADGDGPCWPTGLPEHERRSHEEHVAPAPVAIEDDPWAPLDMHDKGTLPIKPFRKMKRLPKRRPFKVLSSDATSSLIPEASVNGTSFAEFLPALQRLLQAEQVQRSLAARAAHHSDAAPDELQAAFDADAGADDWGHADGYGSDAGGDEYVGVPSDDDEEPSDMPKAPDSMSLEALAGADPGSFDAAHPGDAADGDGLSYEGLCRAHIEAFINAAAAAEVQTELAARVSSWRQKIMPAIEEQDARGAFDILRYGDRIINELSAATEEHTQKAKDEAAQLGFEVLASGCQQWEISRIFSAMLQLVNNNNVAIQKHEQKDGFSLQLKDATLPRMTSYLAPSQLQRHEQTQKSSDAAGGMDNAAEAENMAALANPKRRKDPKQRRKLTST